MIYKYLIYDIYQFNTQFQVLLKKYSQFGPAINDLFTFYS